MLSCDTATLLISKREFEKLSIIDGLRLKMHLTNCNLCRRFEEQSSEISTHIKDFSNIENPKTLHNLSEEQKNKLSKLIDNK